MVGLGHGLRPRKAVTGAGKRPWIAPGKARKKAGAGRRLHRGEVTQGTGF